MERRSNRRRREHGRSQRDRRTSKLSLVARWIVLGSALLAPWFFGCAEGWAYLLLCIVVHIGFICWLISIVLGDQKARDVRALYLPLAAFVCLVAVQILPVSPLARLLSPVSWDLQHDAVSVAGEVDMGGEEGGGVERLSPITLSVSAKQTTRSLFLMTTYFAAFVVLASWRASRTEVRRVAICFAVSGFLMAMFAMMQRFSGLREIYGFHSPRHGGNFFGPFSNRNHFAFQMNMLLGAPLALLLSGRATYGIWTLKGWRRRLAWVATSAGSGTMLLGLAVTVMGASVFLSLSRGGVVALAGSLSLLAFVGGVRAKQTGGRRPLMAVIALLVLSAVIWLGWQNVVDRLGTLSQVARDPIGNTRSVATFDTFRCFLRFPVVGCGLGAFQDAFPLVQSSPLQFGRWLHAHNDYAEFVADVGVVGLVVAVWCVLVLVRLWKARRQRGERGSVLFVKGVFVGIGAASIHTALDYSLHKPANAMTLAVMLGLAIAALGERSADRGPREEPLRMRFGARGWCAIVAVTGAICVLLLSEVNEWKGELAFARYYHHGRLVERISDRPDVGFVARAALDEAGDAMQRGCGNPDMLLEVAASNMRWLQYRAIKAETRIALAEQSAQAGALAARMAPSNYLYWLWWARAESLLGRPSNVELLMSRVKELAPPNADVSLNSDGLGR